MDKSTPVNGFRYDAYNIKNKQHHNFEEADNNGNYRCYPLAHYWYYPSVLYARKQAAVLQCMRSAIYIVIGTLNILQLTSHEQSFIE